MNALEAKRALLSCPGDTIQETIDILRMSQVELAERIGRSKEKLNELINGKAPITKETAGKLELVLNIPAHTWLELERIYQEEQLAIEQLEFLQKCKDWINKFPIAKMKKLALLPKTINKEELTESLLRFFRIASPNEWDSIYSENSMAFKINLTHVTQPEAVSVWLRFGEIQSEKIVLNAFDKKAFRASLSEIQKISFEHPDDWQQKLQDLCAKCGVALVYTPCITKAPIYGAARWIKNGTVPLIQMTDRQKQNNAFWFTFYHECCHILLHGKKDIFIENLREITQDAEKEAEADEFAAKHLFDQRCIEEICALDEITPSTIKNFSKKYQIHPSIIVAQLQRNSRIAYNDVKMLPFRQKIAFDL